MKDRIAFIGPKEYVEVMRFVGFYTFDVLDKKEAEKKIEELEKEEYAVIFVSQDVCPENIGVGRVVSLPGISKEDDPDYLKNEITKALGGEYQI